MPSVLKMFFRHTGNLMLGACSAAVLGHVYLLQRKEIDWISSPVSALSANGDAFMHGAVLFLFAFSQALVAAKIYYVEAGKLTRCIQILSLINAILIAGLSYVYTLNSSQLHTASMAVIASIAGIVMSCLLVRDLARNDSQAANLINGIVLLIWLILIPVFVFLSADYTGAYQRTVAALYTIWLFNVAMTPDRGAVAPH